MKVHIGVDVDMRLVLTVRATSGRVNNLVEASSLLHGQETDVFADAFYQGVHKRPDAKGDVLWHMVARQDLRKLLDKAGGIRAKVADPFRGIKRRLDHVNVRYRGLDKSTAQLHALSNLWMVRNTLKTPTLRPF